MSSKKKRQSHREKNVEEAHTVRELGEKSGVVRWDLVPKNEDDKFSFVLKMNAAYDRI